MTISSSLSLGQPSRTVGIWIECDAAGLAESVADPRIRHIRGLVLGLDALPAIDTIVVPCLPSTRDTMSEIFADPSRPGRLLSDKIKLVTAGRDQTAVDALATWLGRRRARSLNRLAAIGATSSPQSWPAALRRAGGNTPRRVRARLKMLLRLARVSLRLCLLDTARAALAMLPPAHASVAKDLRRRGVAMAWIVPPWGGECWRFLPGRRLIELGGYVPHSPKREAQSDDAAPGRFRQMRSLITSATAIVVPSRHAAASTQATFGSGLRPPIAVVPPAPLPAFIEPFDPDTSRRLLADALRAKFSGGTATPPHRHFCDFPFERIEYVVAAAPGEPCGDIGIVSAYASLLRRRRRDLKLVVDGRIPTEERDGTSAMGLVFDIVEADGLHEADRARLLRHARAVVVPWISAGAVPALFAEAVGGGTPVVMARFAALRESFTENELASPEYFDPALGAPESLIRAILHVLDHRAEVLTRQQAILARLAKRTWADVAADYLAVWNKGSEGA